MSGIIDPRERERAHQNTGYVDFYAEALKASERFRNEYDGRLNLVKSHQMPFERSPDGLIKHIVNDKMDTKECCLDIYMQFLPPGASGKHPAYLSEEVVYVVEGKGYDLHWDVRFERARKRWSSNGRASPSAMTGSKAISSTSRPIAPTSTSTPIPNLRKPAGHRDLTAGSSSRWASRLVKASSWRMPKAIEPEQPSNATVAPAKAGSTPTSKDGRGALTAATSE